MRWWRDPTVVIVLLFKKKKKTILCIEGFKGEKMQILEVIPNSWKLCLFK